MEENDEEKNIFCLISLQKKNNQTLLNNLYYNENYQFKEIH